METTRLELYYSHKPFLIENNERSRQRFLAFDLQAPFFFKLRDQGKLSKEEFQELTKRLTGVPFNMETLTDQLFTELEQGLTFKC